MPFSIFSICFFDLRLCFDESIPDCCCVVGNLEEHSNQLPFKRKYINGLGGLISW